MCEAGHPPDDHNCPKNHFGSAKSMEPAIAVRIITQNKQLQDAKVRISTFIGDEDATTIHEIRRNSEIPVEKWSDLNHVEKSFSSALYDLKVGFYFSTRPVSDTNNFFGLKITIKSFLYKAKNNKANSRKIFEAKYLLNG